MTPVWTFEHSIECGVPVDFAWHFWTTVSNWALDVDVVSVELDGPFAAGTEGVTLSKSSGRISWRIAEIEGRTAVIEFPGPNVTGRFYWRFEEAGVAGRTRITQRATMEGELIPEFASALEAGIPPGMQKLCDVMEQTSRGV